MNSAEQYFSIEFSKFHRVLRPRWHSFAPALHSRFPFMPLTFRPKTLNKHTPYLLLLRSSQTTQCFLISLACRVDAVQWTMLPRKIKNPTATRFLIKQPKLAAFAFFHSKLFLSPITWCALSRCPHGGGNLSTLN